MRISQHTLPLTGAEAPKRAAEPTTTAGGHHDHGWAGTAMHIGHDVAMIGMSIPCCNTTPQVVIPEATICGSGPAAQASQGHNHAAMGHDHAAMGHDHAAMGHDHSAMGHDHSQMGHDHGGGGHAHHAGGGVLNNVTAGISAAVAVGAAIHGAQMITSDDTLTKLEGANHLLMSASCGVMATQMFTGNASLNPWSVGLMAAHGLGEAALGIHTLVKGIQDDCPHHKMMGITKTVHGACLAAAQVFPGAALPLYLAMGAATTVQAAMADSH